MSDMEETELPLTKEAAHERFAAAGVSVFFQKVLTTSDTSGSGRIVIPKVRAAVEELR